MEKIETGQNQDAYLERIKKMSRFDNSVLHAEDESSKMTEEEREDEDEKAFEPDTWIKNIEQALAQKIEVVGDKKEKVNLELDSKLEGYREITSKYFMSDSLEEKDSPDYKDSLYKLTIAGILRVAGKVSVEEAFDAIESKVGVSNIDGIIFNSAWKDIKDFIEEGLKK